MPYAYVYAPVSGTVSGRNKYCTSTCACAGDGNLHSLCTCGQPCVWYDPVDIRTCGSTPSIWLYVSSDIKSIRTFIQYLCCGGAQNDYGRAIIVELYAQPNAVCYIGSVKFGHVAFPRVQHGQIYNISGSIQIGTVMGGSYGNCYTGPHTHMERSGGETVAPCCCATVSAGTTPIYRWYYQTPCPTSLATDQSREVAR